MKISSIDLRKIFYTRKTSDYFHIKFDEMVYDGHVIHPAGEIVARRVTEEEQKQYLRAYGEIANDMIYSESVTRYGTMFWDEGRYIPPTIDSTSS